MMETVSETSNTNSTLTWLIAEEDFIRIVAVKDSCAVDIEVLLLIFHSVSLCSFDFSPIYHDLTVKLMFACLL
jgi:hypothetical protein